MEAGFLLFIMQSVSADLSGFYEGKSLCSKVCSPNKTFFSLAVYPWDTTHLVQVNFMVSTFCNHIGNIFLTLKPIFRKASFKILKNSSNLDLRPRKMSLLVASLC